MELVVDNGKVTEPSVVKKILSAVTLSKETVILMPAFEVQSIIAQHLWAQSKWLAKYKSARMEFDEEQQCYVIRFFTDETKT